MRPWTLQPALRRLRRVLPFSLENPFVLKRQSCCRPITPPACKSFLGKPVAAVGGSTGCGRVCERRNAHTNRDAARQWAHSPERVRRGVALRGAVTCL